MAPQIGGTVDKQQDLIAELQNSLIQDEEIIRTLKEKNLKLKQSSKDSNADIQNLKN